MISQTQNIAGIQQSLEVLKPSEATLTGKQLPANNSFVQISVLGKYQNGYRLLIDGNVFKANLPFGLNAGESFLAKVISNNPFTLSLDDFFSVINMTDGKLAQLLTKLNVSSSQISIKLLKAYINQKKPVIKSRFNKLLEIIENEKLEIDDPQLQLLLQVLDTYDRGYDHLNKSFVSLFQYSLNGLSAEIMGCVQELFSSSLPDQLKAEIDNSFVFHFTEDNLPDAISIKNRTKLQVRLLKSLEAYLNIQPANEYLKEKVSRLMNSMTHYLLLKANNQKAGLYPDFVIIEAENKFELFEYQLDRAEKTLPSAESFGFDLKMLPDTLGEVSINGYLSANNLKADFTASEEAKNILEDSKEELIETITKNIKLNPTVDFIARNNSNLINRPKNRQSINVSV